MSEVAMILEDFTRPRPIDEIPRQAPVADAERRIAEARSEGHALGYEEGAAAALAAHDLELKMLMSSIAEAVSDLGIEGHGARQTVQQAVPEIARALAEHLMPAYARDGLAAEVADLVRRAALRLPDARIVVTVAPDMQARVAERLAESGADVDVRADPDCPGLRAQVRWADGFDTVDIGAAMADAVHALGAAEPMEEGRANHG
ncbi:MAG: hypothetical protein AAGE18_02420 [Pseudomonadota bacterium]